MVTQREDVVVGDTLCSETSKVSAYDFLYQGVRYILVDTPGFDDTNRPDSEITESILTWCRDSLVAGQKLNGVIYIHSIFTPRMGGSALRNVRVFRKLVGVDAFKNVVLATTFWEQVAAADAENRGKELQENPDFWGAMLEKGAKMVRLEKENRPAGLALLEEMATNSKVILKAQDEIVNEGKAIDETDAAKAQKREEELARELEAERQAEKERIQRELEEQARLAREKQLEVQREMERKLQEERRANELANQRAMQAAREHYEWQQRQQAAERQRQEEQYRRDRENMERRMREEQQRQRRVQEALREEYQRRYRCIGYRPKWPM